MKLIVLFLIALGAWAQPERNGVPGETVVADLGNGLKLTAREVIQFVQAMSGPMPGYFEQNPKEFTRQLALLARFAALAEELKLPERSPHKERVAYQRMNVLMQGLLDEKSNANTTQEEMEKYFQEHPREFAEAQCKVLYVGFSPAGQVPAAGAPKPLTEAEAKAKIEGLRKAAVAGADFLKLIQENSDDAASRQKNGDYPPLRLSDPIPDPVKQAVFALQPGAYSEVIRQPNGFYLFRLEKLSVPALANVRDKVAKSVSEARFRGWFEGVRQQVNTDIKFLNEDFFKPSRPAAGSVPVPSPPKP